jgi:hypothetical protein
VVFFSIYFLLRKPNQVFDLAHRLALLALQFVALSIGDRVQFTAPCRDEGIAISQLGTVEQIAAAGNLQFRLDSGQDMQLNIPEGM